MPGFTEDRRADVQSEANTDARISKLKEVLRALSKGQIVDALPDGVECSDEIAGLSLYMKEVQHFLLSISNGELSTPFNYKGPLAAALKSLQANLRHLTWQTIMIAHGDLSQRVDFMGEFSTSFNTMVDNLREARAQLVEKNQELQRLNREMQEDLMLAREVQSATMNFLSDLPFLHSVLAFRPYAEVSGDFYDTYISDDERSLSLFLGDATGHGVAAAFITMMVKVGLSSLPRESATDEVIRRLNRMLEPCMPMGRFLTGIYLRLTAEGLVTTCNAGHPPLLIVPSDGNPAVVFDRNGMVMGISAHEYARYEEHSYMLKTGDRLFLYTDGVTECSRAGERYGIERLMSFLESSRSLDLETLFEKLLKELSDFMDHDRFQDDLTMIGFQFR